MDGKTVDIVTNPGNPRREFLRQVGLLTGGAAVLGLAPFPHLALAADQRTYASGHFALELDGQNLGYLKSFEGGFARAEVVTEQVGNVTFAKKHIASVRYQDIVLQTEPIMPKPLNDWVAAMLSGNPLRKNGAIVTASFDNKEQSRLQFNNALISEVTFPACDASSKEAAYLTIKLSPENSTPLAGSMAPMKADMSGSAKQKQWLPANFRFTIPGIDCSKVAKIDAFTVKNTIREDQVGKLRETTKEPAKLEFPNLSLSVAEVGAGGFYAWFQDMVIKGNSTDKNERQGKLELLGPDMKTVLFTLNFQNLGIFGFTPDKVDANKEQIRRVSIDLYCERITIGA